VARYTDDSRDRVRDAVDMVDLVGSRVELRRAGVNRFEGLCPFHDERTPSFGINPAEKLYYCFGCGQGGDAFKFVQETEGVDFKGALEYLGDRYGIQLEVVEEDPAAAKRRAERERLLELLERTAAFYVRYLWDSAEAAQGREYLATRGLDEGTLREFRVGYAPSAWDKVLIASRRAGFTDRELVASGLAVRAKGEGRTYDRFRRRIMFPLCDWGGRVLGFGARAIGADQKPKYLNSSDNAAVGFHKGRHLFGTDIARRPANQAGTLILVEGYTDVIALHQAGIRNSVGIMGTALTDEQVREIPRLAPRAVIALDADSAGKEAMVRAAKVGERHKVKFAVVPLPPNQDPADLVVEEGARAMSKRVDGAVPFARFRVERELETGDLSNSEGKDAVIAALGPVFSDLEESALRNDLIALVANRIDLSPDLTTRLIQESSTVRANAEQSAPTNGSEERPRARGPLDKAGRAERNFLAQCLAAPAIGSEALAAMDLEAAFSSGLMRRAAEHFRSRLTSGAVDSPVEDDLSSLVAEISVLSGELRASEAALEAERLRLDLFALDRQITAAQAAGASSHELSGRWHELQRRIGDAEARSLDETHTRD
jgi:DNA primase